MGNKYSETAHLFFFTCSCCSCCSPYKSMPYSWHIHSTAFGGSIFVVGFTPKPARTSRLLLSQR